MIGINRSLQQCFIGQGPVVFFRQAWWRGLSQARTSCIKLRAMEVWRAGAPKRGRYTKKAQQCHTCEMCALVFVEVFVRLKQSCARIMCHTTPPKAAGLEFEFF